MSFYEEISPYYDYIFPVGEEQVGLIADIAGIPPKRILDIACGTGGYSLRLAQLGHDVCGMDADPEMIRLAGLKAADGNVPVTFFAGDMLELGRGLGDCYGKKSHNESGEFDEYRFDCIFCIGNSIVHLGSTDAIRAAVIQMKEHLKPGGSIVLQIINFDRVLSKGVTSLPTIVNEEKGIEFQRNYSLDDSTGLIHFDTVLTADKNGEPVRLSNRVKLFPLGSSAFRDILKDAGFGSFMFYGDFSRSLYVPEESFMLVAVITS